MNLPKAKPVVLYTSGAGALDFAGVRAGDRLQGLLQGPADGGPQQEFLDLATVSREELVHALTWHLGVPRCMLCALLALEWAPAPHV